MLMGEEGRFSSIWWQSKGTRRVVRRTLAGETLALSGKSVLRAHHWWVKTTHCTCSVCHWQLLPSWCCQINQVCHREKYFILRLAASRNLFKHTESSGGTACRLSN
jgi:hypothetical protein